MVIHAIVHLAGCCYWQVPSGVTRITWEIWGAGGNGHGACSCNRCQNWHGAGVVDTTIQKLFQLTLVVTIPYVLLVFTVVVLGSVQGVADVTPM